MIFHSLKKKLIVSCQAEGDSPFNHPQMMAAFAEEARRGGAGGFRTEGIENLKAIRRQQTLPVIGLIKDHYSDGSVCISRRADQIRQLQEAGADIVAVDGTFRIFDGMDGPSLIRYMKSQEIRLIMADISSPEEALACIEAGADCISTTLGGYTPHTAQKVTNEPDFDLLTDCLKLAAPDIPVFAEGRYNRPEWAARAIESGAWSVVVGSASTRPHLITKWFCHAISERV